MNEVKVPLFDFLTCISDVMDWLSPLLVLHHKQVALASLRLAEAMNLPRSDRDAIVMAGMLHDIGAISLTERMETLKFEEATGQRHAEMGFILLRIFEPLSQAAEMVRFHHIPWNHGAGLEVMGIPVPVHSHILHLADRVAVLIDPHREVLEQADDIIRRIRSSAGILFEGQLVETFTALAQREYFWLDLVSPAISKVLRRASPLETIRLSPPRLLEFANLFRRIIDFRSPFTATHSRGVAYSAEALSRLSGFSEQEGMLMRTAGYFHDLGKLAIPTEIIEKPGALTRQEGNVMRGHTFYTFRTLEAIEDFHTINAYASFHHERLDGSGYPFHLKGEELPLGARILAVADVFTAIMEDRPYRRGMATNEALNVLQTMAGKGKLDPSVVELLRTHFDQVDGIRQAEQQTSIAEYQEFLAQVGASLQGPVSSI
jgi:HD-GYP domain-containing protein (c-di-GMP phosphodiesterase class II)